MLKDIQWPERVYDNYDVDIFNYEKSKYRNKTAAVLSDLKLGDRVAAVFVFDEMVTNGEVVKLDEYSIDLAVDVNGRKYIDGGVAVPVPLEKALEMGADKIVFALSKPKFYRRSSSRNDILAKILKRKYPNAAKTLLESNAEYDRLVDKAIELEKEGRVLIVSPDDTCGVDTLTKDKDKLHMLYEKGYKDAEKIKEFLYK